jgi:hypothetical protein
MEYIRDAEPGHADKHMFENLKSEYPFTPIIPYTSKAVFKLDSLINNGNRTSGKPEFYKAFINKAKTLISESGYQSRFDD